MLKDYLEMNDELYHYNHNHDPKTGRFARSLRTSSNLAMDINELAVKKEPKISNDVKEAVEKSGGKLYGFDNRIKRVESIERKINTDSKEKNISLFEASKIKDAVRYTSISMDNDFVKSYNSVKKKRLKVKVIKKPGVKIILNYTNKEQ